MLSINTNLSSLIVQGNLQKSTDKLNQAIERMTTGYKINHASDNAANYSIATKMDTKIGAYMVAEENASMGLDLLMTAEGSLNLISDKLSRLRSLAVTAQNGTYGVSSISALESEAEALISEIKRDYSSAGYNGLTLFATKSEETAGENPKVEVVVDEAKRVSKVSSFDAGETYYISKVEDLVALQNIVNADTGSDNGADSIFELACDLDMTGVAFEGIGKDSARSFAGTFKGNGYEIQNLNAENALFEYCGGNVSIDSLGIENCKIQNGRAALIGKVGDNRSNSIANSITITNCYATGTIITIVSDYVKAGGLLGEVVLDENDTFLIRNCYSECDINGSNIVGGLIGSLNSYRSSSIVGSFNIEGCYSTGDVISQNSIYTGGLIGVISFSNATIQESGVRNCFSTGNVLVTSLRTNTMYKVLGGLVGYIEAPDSVVSDCYASGNVEATCNLSSSDGGCIGGLVGCLDKGIIENSYSTGNVVSTGGKAGGIVGSIAAWASGVNNIVKNCYSTSNVTGGYAGGIAGSSGGTIENCYTSKNVINGYNTVGGIVGSAASSSSIINNCFSVSCDVSTNGTYSYSGGITGDNRGTLTNCYASNKIEAQSASRIGGVAAYREGGTTSNNAYDSALCNKDGGGATAMTMDEIKAKYTPEYMGFTESNGWVIVDGMPRLAWEDIPVVDEGTGESGGILAGKNVISFQVGIGGNKYSTVSFDVAFDIEGVDDILTNGLADVNCLTTIDNMLKTVSNKATEYGAMQNRLMSVLEEISVQYDNLVSSRSTIKDADMAEISSQYIQQQILQQASATLLATANQTPALALQLL